MSAQGEHMRRLILVLAIGVAACGGGGGDTISDAGTSNNGNLDGHTDPLPGTTGSTCSTACDCQPGLSCYNGKCGTGGMAYYCCTATMCPNGSTCQDDTGKISTCGGGTSTPVDMAVGSSGGGGLPSFGDGGFSLPGCGDGGFNFPGFGGDGGLGGGICGVVDCKTDSDCTGGFGKLLGCTKCDTTAGSCI
jgi:hypothetical protein